MRAFGVRLVWLVALWLLLWEDLSVGNLIAGLLVGALVLWGFPPGPVKWRGRLRPIPALKFLIYFQWKLIQASAVVAWETATPRNRINEGIVAVPIRHVSEGLTTLVANSISLTPGSLTIDVDHDPTVLYIHVLHLREVEDVRRDVQTLELMAIKAFGDDEAVRLMEREAARNKGERAEEQT